MLSAMAKTPKKTKATKPADDKPAGIYFRPDPDTDAALASFIFRQVVEPSAGAVALTAMRYFLQAQGDYPPKKPAK